MHKTIGKLLLLLLLVSFFISSGSPVFAKDYIVKGYIFVPADYKDKPNQSDTASITAYKAGIVSYLQRVRDDYYARILNGKTFNFDRNVEVVYSDKDLNRYDALPEQFGGDDQRSGLEGFQKFSEEDGVIKVVWIVGASHPYGIIGVEWDNVHDDTRSPQNARIALRYEDLHAVYEDKNSFVQKLALETLAHELGHAFGLTSSGHATSHPCTLDAESIKYQTCKQDAPQPYAPATEWQTLMGYKSPTENWPNIPINNTDFNPELWKLYKSPFVNPQGDPGPDPHPSYDNQNKTPVVTGLSSTTVNAGQDLTIQGANLNEYKNVEIWKWGEENTSHKLDIKSNDGSNVVVSINRDIVAVGSTSEWVIKLFNDKEEVLVVNQHLTIRGVAATGITITVHANTTCGPDQGKPIPVLVSLNDSKGQKASGQSDASAPIVFTVDTPEPGQQFTVIAEAVNNIKPSPEKYVIDIPTPPADVDKAVSFRYPDSACPAPVSGLTPVRAVAVVHGFADDSWIQLPQTWKKISVGGRVYINNDPAACIMRGVKLQVQKIQDASGADIPSMTIDPTFVTVGTGNVDGMTTNGTYLNCQSYWVNLDSENNSTAGTYQLKLSYEGDNTYQPVENLLTFTVNSDNKVIIGKGGSKHELVLPPENTKTVTHAYIYGKEIDLNNPQIPLEYDLPGTEGVSSSIDLPGLVQYSDGSSKSFTLHFKYQSVAPSPTITPSATPLPSDTPSGTDSPAPTPAPTATADPSGNCSNPFGDNGQWRYECAKNTSCPVDSSQGVGFPFRCEDGQWVNKAPSGECTSQCKPNCGISSSRYCIACHRVVVVNNNTCTNLATIVENADNSCNDLSFCNNPASCQAPYTQCGGTLGLETEPSDHVFYITPVCDSSGGIEYRKVDLGRLEGQCGL